MKESPHITAGMLSDVLQSATHTFHRLAALRREPRHKADGSLVTSVDLGLDCFLREQLTSLAPDAGWQSEESSSSGERPAGGWTWIVDPLDGTKEFAHGVPEFAISIGLLHEGRVRAGAVVNPMSGFGAATGTDRSWASWPPFNDRPAPRACTLDTATASVSRTETEDGSVAPFINLVGEARPVGSVAYKLLRVACGIEDMTFSVQPKWAWDICGGIALLEARGMIFRRLDGRDNDFGPNAWRVHTGFVAGPETLVERLAASILKRMSEMGK